ncbi:rhamnogalacturonan acetylesterase [Sphingomonas montana]|uniref:rhamnogalacturonan acetylesterase n=1 Tax=Sphingomonas montana TaxID=1843236 RepID=UPI00096FCE46|nr:rhamnogalacturonan acetylesterase [Sphingomonas montana]
MIPSLAAAALLLATATTAAPPAPGTTIFIAGDSTAAPYRANRAPQTGWGMLLPCALDATVRVENRAVGGRSTRTFITEGRLDRIAADIRAGDVLLIQFGHNDASIDKPERYARADTDYVINLLRYIGIARKAGAFPVLLTPVPRNAFTGATADESFPRYAAAMRRVAQQTNTPLIEVGRQGAAWLTRTGAARAQAYYLHLPVGTTNYPRGLSDNTHFSEAGARGIATIVARGLRGLNLPVSTHVRGDVAPPGPVARGPMACPVRR